MRLNKKVFKKVCKVCMNGTMIKKCPSETCLLAPVKDGKRYKATIQLMKDFCKSCDPEGYNSFAVCETKDGCPLQVFYNHIWANKKGKGRKCHSDSTCEVKVASCLVSKTKEV